MATVKELRARFTAQAEGMKAVARSVRKDLQSIGDTTEKSVEKTNSSFKTLNKSLDDLDKQFQGLENTKGFEGLNKSIRQARTELTNTGKVSAKSMKELQSSVSNAKKHISSLGEDGRSGLLQFERKIDQVDNQLRQFGKKSGIDDLNDELEKAEESAGGLGDKLASVGASARIGGLGSVFVGLGNIRLGALAAVGAVAGLAAGVVGLIRHGDTLQQSLNKLEQQTDSSAKEMEEMEESLKNIYRNGYGESFQDIADAMANVKQVTGLTGDELESATQKALLLRDSMGFEVKESMRTVSVMMKNFGITSDEAFTLLAQGQQMGVNASEDMLDTFLEYSPLFKQLGFDAEGMLNVLNTGMQAGVRNSDVLADTIKEFGIRVKDESKLTAESFAGLGLNADEMAAKFAKGGDSAQEAFSQTMAALAKIEDPLARNTIGVGLFGTKFEDLEYEAVLALGNVEDSANMSADTLEKIDKLQFNSVGGAVKGMGRILQTDLLMPIQEKLMPHLNKAANFLKDNLPTAIDATKRAFKPLGDVIRGIYEAFGGNEDKASSILEKMGLSSSEVQQIINAINLIKVYINGLIQGVVTGFQMMSKFIKDAWSTIFPFIQPLLLNIAAFVGSIVSQITTFWKENGSQIMQAVKNAFNFILGVIKFIMPAVLFIIDMVWSNIKGVIQGALNIIMGLMKIFAGLFTGDFKKMWEGVKQLFFGAIQFVWNLINLLLIGRILKGIGAFITGAKNLFTNLWTNTVNIFKNLDQGVSSVVGKLIGYLRNSWNTAKDNAVTIFTNIKNTISGIWDDIIKGAKELPGKIGDGIKNMAGKAVDGVKSLGNKLASGLENVVNLITQQGINTVLSKLGVDEKHRIPKLDIPEYAKGTDGHKGGLAILGDGKKKELYITPDGQIGLSPATDTIMNLPKGTQVLSGENTEKVLGNVPMFAKGTGFLNDAWNGVKSGASKVKDFAFDVWDYASNPKKLLSKVLDTLNLPKIDISGAFGQIAKGSISMIKDKAVGFVKGLIPSLDFGGGGSSVNITGGASAWRGMIIKAAQAMGESLLPSELSGIIAQIQRESGGNQRIVQSSAVWDVNTAAGNPARGLLQYIPQTFRAYSVKGFNNIYDGYHQLLAFFNNTSWRRDLPYGRRGWGPRGGRKINGFFEGARVAAKQLAWIAEKGAEYIIPTDGGQRAYELWLQAGEENGFSGSDNNNSPTQNRSGSSQPIIINPAPVIIDGHELTEIIFPYVDAKQSSELSNLSSVYGGKG